MNGWANQTEAAVAETIATVLGEYPDDRGVSWFDLGGDSISALHLLGKLQQLTGVRVRLAELARNSTVEGIAGVIRSRLTAPLFSCVTIHHPAAESSETIVVYVHSASGNPYAAYLLGKALKLSVLAVRAAGLEGERSVPSSIEDYARLYVPQLREAAGGRPMWLAGFATGGLVAYEIARQLRADGEQPAGVLAIETPGSEQLSEPATSVAREVFAAVQKAGANYEALPGTQRVHFLRSSETESPWSALGPQLVTADIPAGRTERELYGDPLVHQTLRRWILGEQ